jgi:hypothetical protein
MEQNYNVITNLFIGITYLFSIILIIDELYNIGFFTFNYTYQFNYGTFTSKFNNLQTIECETSRFNVYNNINFLYKDIFNKSYFNYLLLIVATLITILCSVAYAVYFYFKFIIEQPLECSYDIETDLSFIKQILKCLCDECHKLIPNCTSNYFVVFVLLIIIPLSYIFKTLFNINFTPNSNNVLFGFIYICIFILLIFYYSFNLFNRKTEDNYKDLIVHSLFTIIFISSSYIYRYIYSKYNNINLNTSNDNTTIYDIYKQTPPIKPKPIQKPLYKGSDLLSNFKYDENNKEPDYKIKKTIIDDYHKSIKNYDTDMKNYNIRYNAYNNSLTSTKLGDKTNYFDITIKILGLNNYMHIYLIILMIISLIIYNIYKDDISYVCFIYALTLLIALTIMNSILYYNTYINKYLIYEPMAHYKNDITNANTALNIELNPSSGLVFYNKLINNDKSSFTEINSGIKDGKEILEDIKKLNDISNYTYDNTSNINKDITNYNTYISTSSSLLTNIDKNISTSMFLYTPVTRTYDNSIEYLFKTNVDTINTIYNYTIKIEKFKNLTFKFLSKDIRVTIPMTGYYTYYYYLLKQLEYILNNLITIGGISGPNQLKITTYKQTVSDILLLSLDEFKAINHASLQTDYERKLDTIFTPRITTDAGLVPLFAKIDENIKYCTKEINIQILNKSQTELLNSIYKTKDLAAAGAAEEQVTARFTAQLLKTTREGVEKQGVTALFTKEDKDKSVAEYKAKEDNEAARITEADRVYKSFHIIPIYTASIVADAETAASAAYDASYYAAALKAVNKNDPDSKITMDQVNAKRVAAANVPYIDLPYNHINNKIIYKNYTKGNLVVGDKYELPYLIVNDDDGYEFYLKLSTAPSNLHVISSDITETNKTNFIINSRYKSQINNITIVALAENIWSTTSLTNTYSIPLILNKIADDETKIQLFKRIILAVLFNGICNIQSKFENKLLFDKIKTYKTPEIEFQLNKIYIMPYYVSFLANFITLANKIDTIILLNNSDNYNSFYILLFNAYHFEFIDIKKTINTNINYLMNNSKKIIINTNIITILNDIINYKLLSDENINSDNSDFNKDDDIIKLYNNNKPIINLIIALFENLLIRIKLTISSSSSYNDLCYPSSTSRLIIQDAINKKFGAIIAGRAASASDYNTISKALDPGDALTKKLIDELNVILRNYFNIVIFLLDNLKLNTNTAEIDMITTNYNFYNRDDNIKNIIQKQLIINCDYYSKYNNMDSKQLSYFKINADNVNYNFPILMIIFLIILGEPIFIKS